MHERRWFAVLAATMVAVLILFFVQPTQPNPADKTAYMKIVEEALDSNSPKRFELWHAAQEQVVRLDPHRPAASASFVRSGLFHWYELSDADRHRVVEAVEPLLRDQDIFNHLAEPLFQLTGDFTILRRANPGTESALTTLQTMAITNGRFADYRTLREQLRKRRFDELAQMRKSATPAELVALVPQHPTAADIPLLDGVLSALQAHPIDNARFDARKVNALIDFAIDHALEPLDGLEAVVHIADGADDPQRARLAVKLGQFDRASDIEAATKIADAAQWKRYHLDRALAEIERRNPAAAVVYLQKAEEAGKTPDVLAVTAEIQKKIGNASDAEQTRATLRRIAGRVEQWKGLCGSDVCESASGMLWSEGAPLAMKLEAVQSDNVPPYAEVYVDDALKGEGALSPELGVRSELLPGVRRIDVRVANPMTRNAVRRRIRIE